ncbi:MAG: RluA family pseudouridine synthase [Spirochaetales bacterium]|nr:RluA family pseudouridine synthase [Spirochaetales bacterium]
MNPGPESSLSVFYEDRELLVLNKPPGVAVQPGSRRGKTSGKQIELSLLELAEKQFGGAGSLWVVHRVDQPVSGIVLFARKKEIAASLSDAFAKGKVNRTYLGAVESPPDPAEGELIHYLKRDGKRNISRDYAEKVPGSKKSRLSYTLAGKSERYWFLKITLITGRHHQIRAQLKAVGVSVKGDIKYGARRTNPGGGIHLHAWTLNLKHPVTGEELSFNAPLPEDPVWDAFKT